MKTDVNKGSIQIVMELPQQDKPFIGRARGIILAVTGNAKVPAPVPSVAVLSAHLDEYVEADTLADTRAQGAVAERAVKKRIVRIDLQHLKGHLQVLADNAPDYATAVSIVESAGLRVKRQGKWDRDALEVWHGAISGSVGLQARAVARVATYFWQYSSSLDQKSWIDVPETMKARTVITGLVPGQTYFFRFRARTRTGEVGFSQVVSIIVI